MSNQKFDDTSPLGIFFVKSGSNGETLLFRYPYSIDTTKNSEPKRKSHFAIVIKDDTNKDEDTDGTSGGAGAGDGGTKSVTTNYMPPYTELTSPSVNQSKSENFNESFALVLGITDDAFANLLAVTPKLCGEKFELKVNNLRFVGHPMLLPSYNTEKDLLTFNVVFALKANANHDVVDRYHDLSKRIAIGLSFEERRCGYLSQETKQMIATHDEVMGLIEEGHYDDSPYKLILEKSRLAKDLKRIFEDLFTTGMVHVRLNRWIEISFCLPQKVHLLMLKHHNVNSSLPIIGTENIQKCLQALRPYHGILLLVSAQELLDLLPQDASPAFVRIIRVTSPMKNLIELSADADVTLSQVFHIVAQLVYWAKAIIIYPLCENNVYTIHPLAPTNVNSPLVEKFAEQFPGSESLLVYLSEFSLGLSLSQWKNPLHTQQQQIQQVKMLIWMLQKRLLLQLHTYVFLMPLSKSSAYLAKRVSQQSSERPQSSTNTDVEFSVESSFYSDESFATSPANITLGTLQSSKSTSDDDLSSPKLNSSFSDNEISILSEVGLTDNEVEAILKVPGSKCVDDLKLFAKLCPYFNGHHHLEDIMYYENVRRSVLLSIIDKFRDVLFTCQYEDAAVSQLCPYKLI